MNTDIRILVYSKDFYPSIGGIEEITDIVCDGLTKLGCKVVLITDTSIDDPMYDCTHYSYSIIRKPSWKQVIKMYWHCDVFIHEATSLRMIYPLFFGRRKWIAVHHQIKLPDNFNTFLKWCCYHFSNNIAVAQATADGYRLPHYQVIHNAIRTSVYKRTNSDYNQRSGFVFIGRIMEGKGVELLIKAFIQYKSEKGSQEKLYIIGKENEYSRFLQSKYKESSFFNDILFTGYLTDEDAASLMNKCKVGIIPSTYMEAFGLTSLQHLATGSVTIGSDGDGISEALDGNGILFRKNDVNDLCRALKEASSKTPQECEDMYQKGQKRIEYLSPENVSKRYYDYIKSLLRF